MGPGSRESGFKPKLSLAVKPSNASPDTDKRGPALDSEKHCGGCISALFPCASYSGIHNPCSNPRPYFT